jgi:hypothetical protein
MGRSTRFTWLRKEGSPVSMLGRLQRFLSGLRLNVIFNPGTAAPRLLLASPGDPRHSFPSEIPLAVTAISASGAGLERGRAPGAASLGQSFSPHGGNQIYRDIPGGVRGNHRNCIRKELGILKAGTAG